MLDQLIWKDYRNQKPVLMLGAFFLFGPYLMLLSIFGTSGTDSTDWKNWAGMFAQLSIMLSHVTMLIMGASIIGGERQDRGMEFLLTLPPTRTRILIAKSLFCLVVTAVVYGTLALLNELFVRQVSIGMLKSYRELLLGSCFAGLTMFSVAWLASTQIRGVVLPAVISLSVTVCIIVVVSRYAALQDWEIDEFGQQFKIHLYPSFFVVAAVSFIAGWRLFVQKHEP